MQKDQFNDIGPATLGQLQHLLFSWMLPQARTFNSFNSQGSSKAARSLPSIDELVPNLADSLALPWSAYNLLSGSHHNDIFISAQPTFHDSKIHQRHYASSHLFIYPILAGHLSAGQVTPANILDKCLLSQEVFIPPFQRQEDKFNGMGFSWTTLTFLILMNVATSTHNWFTQFSRKFENSTSIKGNKSQTMHLPHWGGMLHICQSTKPLLVQITTWHLFTTKSSFESILAYS